MRRQIFKTAAILLCALLLLASKEECAAFQKAGDAQSKAAFYGDVSMLKQENNGYVMQVTVGNDGEDFTGAVQVIFPNPGYGNCAYQTELTLPAQGKKQFTITVSDRAVGTARGECTLIFLDEKEQVLQSIPLRSVFGNALTGISVGILSDEASDLSFMDVGGQDFDIQYMSSPLKLVELNQDNLEEYLNGLYFLVIDRFQVSSLTEESIRSIEDWVKGGGWLLIGTGEYAEQTLSGFDEDFIGVDLIGVSEPGEENIVSSNAEKYDFYYSYTGAGIDFTNMAVAELDYDRVNGYFHESTENPALCGPVGDGAVSVFYFSLGDKELQNLVGSYEVRRMYEETMYDSVSYSSAGYSGMEYVAPRALALIDHLNTDMDFTWLEVMVILYVVLVGPVLYLLLRRCKKCEWYWVCAPALGILFIAGVFFLGQGIRVRGTRVYSVTAQKADGNHADTYFLAYHAGVKPWRVRLQDSYDMAGPGVNGYSGIYGQSADDYYYFVGQDGEGLSVGIKPGENFESGFLYAGGRAKSRGTISCDGLKGIGSGSAEGTITNGTDCAMAYLAVRANSYIMIFSDVKAGETIDLGQAVRDGRCVYEEAISYYDEYLGGMLSAYSYPADEKYERDDLAALVIGIGIAEKSGTDTEAQAVLAGVVRDYDKAVADKCSETSYGCLYSYGETEEEPDASN